MKSFILSDASRASNLELKTDFIEGMENFTIHDIKVWGTATEDDFIRAGVNLKREPYALSTLKALATAKNLTLYKTAIDSSEVSLVAAGTALSITTASLTAGTAGVAEECTVAVAASSGITQGDYFKIYNKAGQSYAVWLDKDANGAVPNGPLFEASTYKIKVSVVTGGAAIGNAGLVKAAIEADSHWRGFATIVDGGAGTLTITCSDKGTVTNVERHNEAESGNGSFTVTTTVAGAGDYSKQIVSAGVMGTAVYTLDSTSAALVAGLTLSSSGLISGVPTTTGTPAIVIRVTDSFGQTAISGSLTLTIT